MGRLRAALVGCACAVALTACWSFPPDRYNVEGIGVVDASADAGDTALDQPGDTTVDRPGDSTLDGAGNDLDSTRDTHDTLTPDSTRDALTPDSTFDSSVDTKPCPSQCNEGCAGGICHRRCQDENCACPAGEPCILTIDCISKCDKDIKCDSKGAVACTINCDNGECTKPLVCPSTGDCTINCQGGACTEKIQCGQGRCTITCTGASCTHDIFCNQSCACSVTCIAGGCSKNTSCRPGCNGVGKNCTTAGAGCDVCP